MLRLLRELKEFDKITQVTRNDTYCIKSHQHVEFQASDKQKEVFAKRLIGLNFEELGTILNYQVPIRDSSEDDNTEKIDLISYNKKINTLFLINLISERNNEDTLLKTMLEIYTYYKIINQIKIVNDCLNNYEFIFTRMFASVNPEKINVVPAVLLVNDSYAADELHDIQASELPKLLALILALDVKFYTLDYFVNSPSFQIIF